MRLITDRFGDDYGEPQVRMQLRPSERGDALEGWAVTYRDTPNFSGRIVVPGAFEESLAQRGDRKPLPMGYEHSTFQGTNVIGRWHAHEDRPEGLLLSQGIVSNTTLGRDVLTLVNDGVITGLSVGFLAERTKNAAPGEQVEYQTTHGLRRYEVGDEPVLFIEKGHLMETSLVSAPADDEARMAHLQAVTADAMAAVDEHLFLRRWREFTRDLEGLPPGPLTREGCAMAIKTARALVPHLDGPLPEEAKDLMHALVARFAYGEAAPDQGCSAAFLAAELREAIELSRGGVET